MEDFEHSHFSLRRRIFALICVVCVVFCVLFARLLFLQVFSSSKLQNLAFDQWTRDLPITAERGVIYDRNGAPLAVSYTTYDIYVRAKEVQDKNAVCSFLCNKLNMPYDSIYQKISMTTISEVLVKMQVESSLAKNIKSKGYSGIYLSENVSRYYPYGDMLTQVLGFTTVDCIGQAGLELYYNDLLSGKDGAYLVQSDLTGKQIKDSMSAYIQPECGTNVYTTIDVNIQGFVENALNLIMQEQKPTGAGCIVMKCDTGEIVASSLKPSFDLNNVPRDDVSALLESTTNSLVTNVYEPGSTFKTITMAAAVDCGCVTLDDTFFCSGSSVVDGQKIKCWKTKGHGNLTLSEGLENSCNVVLMALAQRLGLERFYDYIEKFGFGASTGIDIMGESNGIVMNEKYVKAVDLARIGFGQAIAVTPIQLIAGVNAVVNGGDVIVPTITKSIGENQDFVPSFTNKNVISDKTSAIVNQMLSKTTNKQGEYTYVEGYNVGGKTGTAQKYENGAIAANKYVSSFIGTYPADNPEYILLVVVDEPTAGAIYGSIVAAPYGKMIFKNMIDYFGDKPVENVQPVYKAMPYVEKMLVLDAVNTLEKQGFVVEIYGDGEFVSKQLPPVGTNWDTSVPVVLVA